MRTPRLPTPPLIPLLPDVPPPPLPTQPSRAEPPEFDPDPALRLERALCYTGGSASDTLAFLAGDRLVAFPSSNVVVLMGTPRLPGETRRREQELGGGGGGCPSASSGDTDQRRNSGAFADEDDVHGGNASSVRGPSAHVFLRGHTDRVTRMEVSTGGHLLASAQGDPQGAAGTRLGHTRLGRAGGHFCLCFCLTLFAAVEIVKSALDLLSRT